MSAELKILSSHIDVTKRMADVLEAVMARLDKFEGRKTPGLQIHIIASGTTLSNAEALRKAVQTAVSEAVAEHFGASA